jgi:hypothetical protein
MWRTVILELAESRRAGLLNLLGSAFALLLASCGGQADRSTATNVVAQSGQVSGTTTIGSFNPTPPDITNSGTTGSSPTISTPVNSTPPVPPVAVGSTQPALEGTASSPADGQIQFSVKQAGKVSVALFDNSGQMVRTLLNAKSVQAGSHTLVWDGKSDLGNPLPRGTYTYKLLQTPGLVAEYLMTLQTTLPIGEGWIDRQVGAGNHSGLTAIAIDQSGAYVSSGISETTYNALKMSLDGKQRIWSAHQPDIGMGRYSMAVMGGRLYSLQQDAWVSHHSVDQPNVGWSSVGVTVSAAGNGDFVGDRWDALWPATTRGDPNAWAFLSEQPMDLAAFDKGSDPQLVISYQNQNTIQWREPSKGAVLDSTTISAPKGIAIDNNGDVLVASNNQIVKISRISKSQKVVASGLDSPYRIDVDRSNGQIVVAESGIGQQVKRFSPNGALLATYGRFGGRSLGLYDPKNFKSIVDITSDNQGGFWIVEKSSPRRVAHFGVNGELIDEWYGGSIWAPAANPEPGNPSIVWMQSDHGEYIRATLDYENRRWKIHSTYRVIDLNGAPIGSLGAGLNVLKPRRVNGQLYLAQDSGGFGIWKVNESNWTTRAVSAASFQADLDQHWIWTDSNGDGIAQSGEYKRYKWKNFYSYHAQNLRTDEKLNYFAMSSSGAILRIPVIGWNSVGAPLYPEVDSPDALGWSRLPSEVLNLNGSSNRYGAHHTLSFDQNGGVFGAIDVGDFGWSAIGSALVARWNSDGKIVWKKSLTVAGGYGDSAHTYVPGEQVWSAFRNNVGIAYGNMIAQDFNGGHASYPGQAITYVWNYDGLFVGGMFDKIDTSKVVPRFYNLGSENGAGAVHEEPSTGAVLYFGGTESANHVYRVRGWSGWLQLSGSVIAP